MTPRRWAPIRYFADASPGLRTAAAAMWCAGLLVLFAGLAGDSWNWWTSSPFLTNVASSFTGALFGVPFAVIFLQGVAKEQAERIERRNALAGAEAGLQELVAAVALVSPAPPLYGPEFHQLVAATAAACGQFRTISARYHGYRDAGTVPDPRSVTAGAAQQSLDLLHRLRGDWAGLGVTDELVRDSRGHIIDTWQHFRLIAWPRLRTAFGDDTAFAVTSTSFARSSRAMSSYQSAPAGWGRMRDIRRAINALEGYLEGDVAKQRENGDDGDSFSAVLSLSLMAPPSPFMDAAFELGAALYELQRSLTGLGAGR